ncbi:MULTISPECIES: hypothetical protein [unclassified Nocardia]|uniref:hypothetical protein n=1 Tax=unclassified Nocardia TaxID=2637762 RepID=UPI001CE41D93|nr:MULTISPECIES: hypothetical protein [unclassified Nocardia]
MGYEFAVLPPGVAATADDVAAHIDSQRGQAEDPALTPIAAGVCDWNTAIPVWNARAMFEIIGDCLRVAVPDHAGWRMLATLEELLADTAFLLYDAGDSTLGPVEMRRDVRVSLGGVRTFSTLTHRRLRNWLPRLAELAPAPFLTVDRAGTDSFIQTYRNAPDDYRLEVRDDEHVGATVHDPLTVADLIWAWSTDRWDGYAELVWEPVD